MRIGYEPIRPRLFRPGRRALVLALGTYIGAFFLVAATLSAMHIFDELDANNRLPTVIYACSLILGFAGAVALTIACLGSFYLASVALMEEDAADRRVAAAALLIMGIGVLSTVAAGVFLVPKGL